MLVCILKLCGKTTQKLSGKSTFLFISFTVFSADLIPTPVEKIKRLSLPSCGLCSNVVR